MPGKANAARPRNRPSVPDTGTSRSGAGNPQRESTTRLIDSPACLVVKDSGISLQLARVLKQAGQAVPDARPVLEINPGHPLVKKLDGHDRFDELAHILFDQALLAEGGLPDDPAAYVRRVNALLA